MTYQCVGDGVPHALDGAAGAALALEPLREADVVQRTHVLHGRVEVQQRLSRRAEREGRGHSVCQDKGLASSLREPAQKGQGQV